jgi:hypothetical protein
MLKPAGDLNVVIVGSGDTVATVTSVTGNGKTYQFSGSSKLGYTANQMRNGTEMNKRSLTYFKLQFQED